MLSRPEPKPSIAKRKPRAQGRGERGYLGHVARRAFLGALEAQPLRLGAAGAQMIAEPLDEGRIAHRFP
jgi:hypothetical protein